MRILVDYRPALRERTGVGEYVHELARALLALPAPPQLTLWTNSWRDRPQPEAVRELAGARIVDRRFPVRALTWAWHHLEWPVAERLAGAFDVVHSQSPLLIPTAGAAQVVTIHDLDFLQHPERTRGEMRRDFPALAQAHAQRADAIIVSSRHAAGEVTRLLRVEAAKVHLCPAGTPAWVASVAQRRGDALGRSILFLGTLEPRKNLETLLDAYARLRAQVADAPPLVLAGRATDEAAATIDRVQRPPFSGHVELTGYVNQPRKEALFLDARMLVLPSLDEGFGLPVLEAMACGVPVVISNRGSLPEVAGDAAIPVAPTDAEALAARMRALLDEGRARAARARGLSRAAAFDWADSARGAMVAYAAAMTRRHAHRG